MIDELFELEGLALLALTEGIGLDDIDSEYSPVISFVGDAVRPLRLIVSSKLRDADCDCTLVSLALIEASSVALMLADTNGEDVSLADGEKDGLCDSLKLDELVLEGVGGGLYVTEKLPVGERVLSSVLDCVLSLDELFVSDKLPAESVLDSDGFAVRESVEERDRVSSLD